MAFGVDDLETPLRRQRKGDAFRGVFKVLGNTSA